MTSGNRSRPTQRENASIRMGEIGVTADRRMLKTLLGSCVGVAVFDPQLSVGGLAHVVLPQAPADSNQPGKYADTAIPLMIEQLQALAPVELQLTAKIAGGASMFANEVAARIGDQNVIACESVLEHLQIPIKGKHCGGCHGRRMVFDTGTGAVTIQIVGQEAIDL